MSSLSYPRIVGALTMAAVTILPTTASSDEALVAVASNFSEVGEVLKRRFEIDGTHTIKLVSGSPTVHRSRCCSQPMRRARLVWSLMALRSRTADLPMRSVD